MKAGTKVIFKPNTPLRARYGDKTYDVQIAAGGCLKLKGVLPLISAEQVEEYIPPE